MTVERVTLIGPAGEQVTVSSKVARLLAPRGYRRAPRASGPLLEMPEVPRRAVRVLAHVHRYPPVDNAGAEVTLHVLLRHLVKQGHRAAVITGRGERKGWSIEGVEVHLEDSSAEDLYERADVVLTHLDRTSSAIQLAGRRGLPLVHLAHNEQQLGHWRVTPEQAALVVWNSRWLYEAGGWQGPQIIVRPAVMPAEYRVRRGKAITLVNLSKAKGADVFYALAARFPERLFLGVKGAYGHQEVPRRLPANVEILEHQPDMKAIYSRTRILLVPSSYESWGRVGIEAACSGIPTIAHPTPGLRESLGEAGIFRDRDGLEAWVEALRELDDAATYAKASKRARARVAELDPAPDLELFEHAVRYVAAGR